ncbi:MAG: hypothetical protein LBL69_00415, partial [Zoogloeaceae bacterium]|nr:hypothetical protein [Zoogloeaceae bacterium]
MFPQLARRLRRLLGCLSLIALLSPVSSAFADITLSSNHNSVKFGGVTCAYDADKSAANGKPTWYCASGITISDKVVTSGVANAVIQVKGAITTSKTIGASLKATGANTITLNDGAVVNGDVDVSDGTLYIPDRISVRITGDATANSLTGQVQGYPDYPKFLRIDGRLTITGTGITGVSPSCWIGKGIVAKGIIDISDGCVIGKDDDGI